MSLKLSSHLTSFVASALCLISLLVGCRTTEIRPVDIAAEDMCAFCKMAISEKQYAAEFIDQERLPTKFDDISCMIRYIEGDQRKDGIAAYFVVDFESREWVNAEAAHYVRSSAIQTPMGGGIVAFKDQSRMEAAVAKYRGERLRFTDLLDERAVNHFGGDL